MGIESVVFHFADEHINLYDYLTDSSNGKRKFSISLQLTFSAPNMLGSQLLLLYPYKDEDLVQNSIGYCFKKSQILSILSRSSSEQTGEK